MLCPEVWNFSSRKQNIFHKSGNYNNTAKQTVNKVIRSFAFNKMVSIVLPGCETIPVPLQQLIDAGDHYLVRNLKLCDLVRKDFVEAFLKRGSLTGISSTLEISNGYENIYLITPDGKLILYVNKDLYQILGLEGRPAGLSKRKKERFEITINLKNKDLCEQSKFHKQIKSALSKPEIPALDFYLSWESIDATVCPSSVAKFFNDCGYKVEQHSIQMRITNTTDLKLPSKLFAHHQVDTELAYAMAEYFAMVMLACKLNDTQELSALSKDLALDLHNEDSTHGVIIHCKGLLTADFITNIIEVARLSVDCKSIILSVNGYERDLLAETSGYIISLLNGTKYFLFKA